MSPVAPTIVPAIIAIKRRKMIEAFRVAGAVNPAAARKPEELGVDRGHMFGRMLKSGVFKEVPGGAVWLDESENARSDQLRTRIVLGVVLLGAATFGLVMILTR